MTTTHRKPGFVGRDGQSGHESTLRCGGGAGAGTPRGTVNVEQFPGVAATCPAERTWWWQRALRLCLDRSGSRTLTATMAATRTSMAAPTRKTGTRGVATAEVSRSVGAAETTPIGKASNLTFHHEPGRRRTHGGSYGRRRYRCLRILRHGSGVWRTTSAGQRTTPAAEPCRFGRRSAYSG